MADKNLDQLLDQLHQALKAHPQLDDANKQRLSQITKDIAELDGADMNPALGDKIEQQAVEFEQAHPTLSGILRQIVDTLGRIGV